MLNQYYIASGAMKLAETGIYEEQDSKKQQFIGFLMSGRWPNIIGDLWDSGQLMVVNILHTQRWLRTHSCQSAVHVHQLRDLVLVSVANQGKPLALYAS